MINLLNGDCLELLKDIPDGSVDLILTDLPYGTTACAWDEIIPLDKMWAEFYRVIRMNGFIVLTASQPFTSKLVMSNINNFSHQWVWQKEQGSNPLLANVAPMKNFEDVLVFSNKYDTASTHPLRSYFAVVDSKAQEMGVKWRDVLGNGMGGHYFTNGVQFSVPTEANYRKLQSTGLFNKTYDELKAIDSDFKKSHKRVYNPQKTKGKRYTSGSGHIEHLSFNKQGGTVSDERYPTAVIKFNTDKSRSQHPTQKPVALLEYLIKTYTHEGHTVLDATMGSGSTGVACVNTNRKFFGIELDKDYFKIAQDRINEAINKRVTDA